MGLISRTCSKVKAKFKVKVKQETMFGIEPEPPKQEPEQNLIPLDFGGHPICVMVRDGMSWWPANNVCEILGIGNPRQACARLDDDEKDVISNDTFSVDGQGSKHKVLIINEYGLYSLILSSRKAEAKWFKRWVTHEVLPSIRKTGSYSLAGSTLSKACDRTKERLRNKKQNRKDHDRLRDMGAHVNDYVAHHNAIYLGQFGMAAPELRMKLGMKYGTPLDRMGPVPLSANTHAKVLCERLFEDEEKAGTPVPLKERPAREEAKAREVMDDTMACMGLEYQMNIVEHAKGDIIDVEKRSLGNPNRLALEA